MLFIESMITIRAALALLFRIGSILIQTSSIPVNNVNLIVMQNIVEFATATVTYFTFGNTVVFGDITDPKWTIGSVFLTKNQEEIELAIYAWIAVTTTTCIFTTVTAGRMHPIGYITITALISGLIEPLAMHWVWMPNSFVRRHVILLQNVTFVDYGCISHVHLLAGVAGLLATAFIGRRLMRLKDLDEASLPSSSPTLLTIGYLLITVGSVCLMIPHPMMHGTMVDPSLIKCGLAVVGGLLTTTIVEWFAIRREINPWAIARCLQGGLAGIIIVSNGMDVYHPLICLGLGATGGLVFYVGQHLMFKTPLEDYCNVVPVHLVCGFLSILLSYRLASLISKYGDSVAQFSWELLVNCGLVVMYVAILVPVFVVLECFGILRNHQCEIDYRRAKKVAKSQRGSGCLTRLFPPGSYPELLVPGYSRRRAEYQNERLTEEVEVELKPEKPTTVRKRRQEGENAETNRRKASRQDLEESQGKVSVGVNRNMEARYALVSRMNGPMFRKSRKYEVSGFKKAKSLGAGDAGCFTRTEMNTEHWFKRFEGPAEESVTELVKIKELLAKRENCDAEGNVVNAWEDVGKGGMVRNVHGLGGSGETANGNEDNDEVREASVFGKVHKDFNDSFVVVCEDEEENASGAKDSVETEDARSGNEDVRMEVSETSERAESLESLTANERNGHEEAEGLERDEDYEGMDYNLDNV